MLRLEKQGFKTPIIKRVSYLISHHDDILKDVIELHDKELEVLIASDVFGFLDIFAQRMLKREGKKRLKDKIHFMIRKLSPDFLEILKEYHIENKDVEEIKKKVLEKYF